MEVVYGTMTKVLEKLGFIAYEQISLACGMRDDLMKVRRTMSTVKAVLLDAEEKQEHNREISTWLAELKHVFLDAEEVLDEFECEILRRKVVKLYGSTSQKVRRYLSCSNPLALRINLGHKLKEIRERLDEVADGKTKFHLSERHEETRASHGRTAMTHSYTLKLVGCGNLEGLPRDIKNLISLRFLSLTTKATFFPENGIECLNCLRTLLIFDCESLVSLPRNFRCLTALETLVIGGCTKLRITEDEDNDQVNKLSLKRLQFSHLPEMVALPRWLRGCELTLKLLRLFGCPKLTALPQWLPNMTSLEKLRIMECPSIQCLPEEMHRLTSLREMKIYGCPELSNSIEAIRDKEWIKNIYFEDDPWRPT
ncbi:LRR domain containing protein [Parasponia andersonii]|uniref:LRR domain containing protein n=1 Tax=Parasponia andersonii TaxID=3476 RepID=A0A2P5E546_PARAD|nr:LRR domain containing protein [Parasponia andersonii]